MTKIARPLVLVVRNLALRSTLAARLGLAGETVLSAAQCDEVDPQLRGRALLIVCHESLSGRRAAWPAMLRAQGWDGRIAILVASGTAGGGDDCVPVALGDTATLLALVARWRRSLNPG